MLMVGGGMLMFWK
ncbi:MAG: hypothetical protein L0J84_08360 [Brachybacterium sp.]|nr:hypothetical protein [Brachybacterium sp.]